MGTIVTARPIGPEAMAADRRLARLHAQTLKQDIKLRNEQIKAAALEKMVRKRDATLKRLRA